MDIQKYVDELTEKALANHTSPATNNAVEPLETVLQGLAVELSSNSAGRLFLVADEGDARRVMERFNARRGELYTAAEARRIIAVTDPAVVAEIHDWKRLFDGVVREFRAGDHPR
jgi:hypothetical protein